MMMMIVMMLLYSPFGVGAKLLVKLYNVFSRNSLMYSSIDIGLSEHRC
jgi:hypothetical protein